METCFLCQRIIPEGEPSIWRNDSGESVSVATSVEPLALIDTPSGDLCVCERCYHAALPPFLSHDQLQALHAEFAIEYCNFERFDDAIAAGQRALELGLSADNLAMLAYTHSQLGRQSEAAALYQRALAIEPDHFISTENLKRLPNATGST
jgi:tetratricopeptide (TPR) repeat protein